MVNYLNRYSPRLAELDDSLREFTKKNAPLIWVPKHTKEFDVIKKEITSIPIFRYYYPKKSLTLQRDLNLKAFAVVQFQEGHPVYFATKSLKAN